MEAVLRMLSNLHPHALAMVTESGRQPDTERLMSLAKAHLPATYGVRDVALDLEHAGLRLSHCTATYLLDGPEGQSIECLNTLSGDTLLILNGSGNLYFRDSGHVFPLVPAAELPSSPRRYSVCTHKTLNEVAQEALQYCHGGRSAPGTSYLDGFLSLWRYGGSVVLRGKSAATRVMDPYFNISSHLGYQIASLSDVGYTIFSAKDALGSFEKMPLIMVSEAPILESLAGFYQDRLPN